jgi:hypothetical protein
MGLPQLPKEIGTYNVGVAIVGEGATWVCPSVGGCRTHVGLTPI